MSFNHFARKVMNPNLPIGVRYSALHSCILRLVFKTGESFSGARDRLDAQFGFRRRNPSDYQLLLTLAAIERERNLVLQQLGTYERRRIREKMLGKRSIPRDEQKALHRLYEMEPGATFNPEVGREIVRLPEEQRARVGKGEE